MPFITTSSFTAECYAMRIALVLTKLPNHQYVWFETNSQSLLQALQNKHLSIIYDIKILMQLTQLHKLNQIYKEGNEVTNLLATTTTNSIVNTFPLDYISTKVNFLEHILHQLPVELSFQGDIPPTFIVNTLNLDLPSKCKVRTFLN